MRRRAIVVGLLLLLTGAHLLPPPVAAAPAGSITWTVDHNKKTITALVRLQIFSGCSGNPEGDEADQAGACVGEGSQVTQFLADKIKGNAERIWNKGYHFRCYRLKVIVDVKLAASQGSVDADRLAIRIDPSAVRIRSWVNGESNVERWDSEDPRDRVDPSNSALGISTWTEDAQGQFSHTYAHELGHILGLEDTYTDVTDPVTGKTKSVPIVGSPLDLMNGNEGISQKTIDLLIKRNSERLADKDGNSVDLNDLRCEPSFMVSFRASQNEYGASNVSNSLAHTPCSRAPYTASTTQRMTVDGDQVEVRAVEGGSAVGYILVPAFDAMTVQDGMSGGGRAAGAVGLFDVPIAVDLFRTHSQPADGDIPPVLDLPDDSCPGGDSGHTERPDCGHRDYRAWLALKQDGNELWPTASSLPATLGAIGYNQPRLDKLYKLCPGPWPWPGTVGDEPHATKKPGKLPGYPALQQVYDDWVGQGKPGKLEITGTADVDWVEAGSYDKSDFTFELKLCPIDADGVVSPGCS